MRSEHCTISQTFSSHQFSSQYFCVSTLVQKFRTHVTLGVILCVTCETCCLNGILFWRWFEDLNEKGTLHSVFLPRAWEDFFFRSCCCLYSSSTNFEFLHKNLDWLGHFLKKKHNSISPFIKGHTFKKTPGLSFCKNVHIGYSFCVRLIGRWLKNKYIHWTQFKIA